MEELINTVDAIVFGFVQGSFGGLSATITTLWRMMFIVFIAVYGYKIMMSGRFSVHDLITHCVKIIVLLIMATQWDVFFTFVFAVITDLPADMAGQIMQAAASASGNSAQADSAQSATSSLSRFFDRGMLVSSKTLEGAGWTHWGQYFYAFALWAGTIGLTGYAAMLIILSKLAVAVLLAIGPLFILLLMFTNTRALFEGWLRTLLNYALIPVFVYVLLAILLTLAEGPLTHLEAYSTSEKGFMSYVGPYLLVTSVAIMLLAQVLNMAASVTGGISLSTMGLARTALRGGITAPLAKTGGALGKWGWDKTKPVRKSAWDKTAQGAAKGFKAAAAALQRTRDVR